VFFKLFHDLIEGFIQLFKTFAERFIGKGRGKISVFDAVEELGQFVVGLVNKMNQKINLENNEQSQDDAAYFMFRNGNQV
jgi:hypothetical protein